MTLKLIKMAMATLIAARRPPPAWEALKKTWTSRFAAVPEG
ncbi:MAG TPA: hypothetical protein VNA69_14290 [Thermoanaerobaculia bacterium]|nr:hypothetical protein [Thermoanaerobaculia bacterium]